MSAMTLAQVRGKLASWLGGSEACLDAPKVAELSAMISAIDDSLAQPAQRAQKAVDVQAVMRDAAVWMPSAVESQRVREAGAAISKLIDALIPFSHPDLCKVLPGNTLGGQSPVFGRDKALLTIGDFQRAAAALAGIKVAS